MRSELSLETFSRAEMFGVLFSTVLKALFVRSKVGGRGVGHDWRRAGVSYVAGTVDSQCIVRLRVEGALNVGLTVRTAGLDLIQRRNVAVGRSHWMTTTP